MGSYLNLKKATLEYLTAAIPIDLANAKITSGFFVENTVIVAEGGLHSNGIFKVNTCGFPPLEDRDESLYVLMVLTSLVVVFSIEENLRLSTFCCLGWLQKCESDPDDAGPAKVLPRCALPNYLTKEFQKQIPTAIFSSNPCIVKFYTQEIVLSSGKIFYIGCAVHFLSHLHQKKPLILLKHLVATITHQGHLPPLPQFRCHPAQSKDEGGV